VFQISIWGVLELCLGGLCPPKPPVATGLVDGELRIQRNANQEVTTTSPLFTTNHTDRTSSL